MTSICIHHEIIINDIYFSIQTNELHAFIIIY